MSTTADLFNQRDEALRRFATATTPVQRRALIRLALQEHLHVHRLLLVAAGRPVPAMALPTRQLVDAERPGDLESGRSLFIACRDLAISVAERLDRNEVRGAVASRLRSSLAETADATDRLLARLARL